MQFATPRFKIAIKVAYAYIAINFNESSLGLDCNGSSLGLYNNFAAFFFQTPRTFYARASMKLLLRRTRLYAPGHIGIGRKLVFSSDTLRHVIHFAILLLLLRIKRRNP